jgi:hypothetical protein
VTRNTSLRMIKSPVDRDRYQLGIQVGNRCQQEQDSKEGQQKDCAEKKMNGYRPFRPSLNQKSGIQSEREPYIMEH